MKKAVKILSIVLFAAFCCSCQDKKLKEAGLDKDKIVKDKGGHYYRLHPHVGDTFFVYPLDIEEYKDF